MPAIAPNPLFCLSVTPAGQQLDPAIAAALPYNTGSAVVLGSAAPHIAARSSRFTAYHTASPDAVAGLPSPGTVNRVIVFDSVTQTAICASRDSLGVLNSGQAYDPKLSYDGKRVIFVYVPVIGDAWGPEWEAAAGSGQICVKVIDPDEPDYGTMYLLTANYTTGDPCNTGSAYGPMLSGDGRSATFIATHTDLVAAKTRLNPDAIFCIFGPASPDAPANYVRVASVSSSDASPPNATQVAAEGVTGIIISTTLTVLTITKGRLAVGDVIDGAGVVAGTTIVAYGTGSGGLGTYGVSVDHGVSSTAITVLAHCVNCCIEGPGLHVGFTSNAVNIDRALRETNNVHQLYDRSVGDAGFTHMLSIDYAANKGFLPAPASSKTLLVSANIRYSESARRVIFYSYSPTVVPAANLGRSNIFVLDLDQGAYHQADVDSAGNPGIGNSADPWIDPTGYFAAFETNSPNLSEGRPGFLWPVAHDFVTGLTYNLCSNAQGLLYEPFYLNYVGNPTPAGISDAGVYAAASDGFVPLYGSIFFGGAPRVAEDRTVVWHGDARLVIFIQNGMWNCYGMRATTSILTPLCTPPAAPAYAANVRNGMPFCSHAVDVLSWVP